MIGLASDGPVGSAMRVDVDSVPFFPFDHVDVDCQFQIHDSRWLN
jgi:hypothetical protein